MNNLYSCVVLSSVLLAGCSKELPPVSKTDVIVAFGDSLTSGYGSSPENSYPAQLKKITGYNIVNAGLSGDTAQKGKERIKLVVEAHNPKVVILSIGANDMLRGIGNIQQNLEEMVIFLKAQGIEVILLAEPLPTAFALTGLSDADVYGIVAKEHDLLLLPNIYSKYLSKNEFKSDLIHLNTKGYRLVAEDVAEKLKKSGLIDYE